MKKLYNLNISSFIEENAGKDKSKNKPHPPPLSWMHILEYILIKNTNNSYPLNQVTLLGSIYLKSSKIL